MYSAGEGCRHGCKYLKVAMGPKLEFLLRIAMGNSLKHAS